MNADPVPKGSERRKAVSGRFSSVSPLYFIVRSGPAIAISGKRERERGGGWGGGGRGGEREGGRGPLQICSVAARTTTAWQMLESH